MTERLSTGSDRLDLILNGGLVKNAINLIAGVPGSGKTILSQQVVFRNATPERPAAYLSTLSEPLDKIVRFGESLSFFDRKAIEDGRIVYHDAGSQLGDGGLDQVLHMVDRILKETRPGIVVMDGIRSLQTSSADGSTYRRFLYGLLRRFTATATTAVWNAAYTRAEVLDQPEAAIADAVIALDAKQIEERESRVLQILKLRGSAYRSGEHHYRITAAGLAVYPRLAEVRNQTGYELSPSHSGTGIAALDDLLGGGGYWSGTVTLVAGPTGIGKTLMGLHFLYRGAESGERGILATFQETESQLSRIVTSFGWSIHDPNVRIMSRGLVDLNIDQWVYELIELAESTGARRVVVDSMLDVAAAARDQTRFREWIFSLTQHFSRAGISLMLTAEVADLFRLDRISEHGISHLSDNVILLQYVQDGAELLRAITVLKTRAMQHHPTVRQYTITSDGFTLGDVIRLSR